MATAALSRMRTHTGKGMSHKKDHMISSPWSTTSVTMTTTPQRLSDIDDGILKSMTQNDLAIHLGSLVKGGQMDQAAAMSRFSELSQSLPAFKRPDIAPDDLTDVSYQVKLKNMSTKYTLKFDLKTKGINLYLRGKCKHKIRFDEDVKSFEGDEDNTFILRTASLDLMEFEAEGLEEKNAILEVLQRFDQQRRSAEEPEPGPNHEPDDKNQSELNAELESSEATPPRQRRKESNRVSLEQSLRVPVYKQMLKEGELEKQGHGKGAFSWPIRYVEIKPGQLSYYKLANMKQPLNIITLDQSVTIETFSDGFEIKLRPKRDQSSADRSYNFRIPKSRPDFQKEMEGWLHALDLAVKGTNEKEIMMSLCTIREGDSSSKTISNIKRVKSPNEFQDKQKRRISKVFSRTKTKDKIIREPIPSVELQEPNIAIFLTQFKKQINYLLLLSEEFSNEKVKAVSENMLKICKSMEDQIRGNPDDDIPFQPMNRIFSVSSQQSPEFPKKIQTKVSSGECPLNYEPVEPDIVPTHDGEETVGEDTSINVTEITTIAQLKLDLSSISSSKPPEQDREVGQLDRKSPIKSPLKSPIKSPIKSLDVFPPSPIKSPIPQFDDTTLLNNIPEPPPNMQEAIDYHLLIEKCPTGDPRIPNCPPNMPDSIKLIKTVVLGIPDIPLPPPNLPEVAKKLGVDSLVPGSYGDSENVRKVDMKPLIWNKIGPRQVKINSIWVKAMADSELDFDKLELLFFKDEKKSQQPKQKKLAKKPKKELLLDDKRAMGIDIFLRKSRFNFEELDELLNNVVESSGEKGEKVDDGKFYLQLEELEDLSRYPTEQDNDLFRAVKIKPEDMEKSDRFIHTVCHIQYYKERVEVLLLIREIPENYTHIQGPMEVLKKACDELKNADKFEKILALVLKIGNHINSGSMRGNAGGFHLSILSKLINYKGVDSKFSLLHFIVHHILEKQEELIDFYKGLSTVHKATDASVEGVLAEVDLMKKQLSKIKKTRDLIEKGPDAEKYKEFCKNVSIFLDVYDNKYSELISAHNELRNIYTEVLAKYGEPEDAESDEFMGCINDFIRDFKKVSTDMIKKREAEKAKEEYQRKGTAINVGSSNALGKLKSEKNNKSTTKSPLEQAHSADAIINNEKNIPSTKDESAENTSKGGACKMDWSTSRAAVKKEYGVLQLEKKGRFKTEWKDRKFILSDKQLRCLTTKNEEEDKVYLGKETQIYQDSNDNAIIEIKTKANGKDKKMRIKCPTMKSADDLLKDFKQAQS